MAAAPFRIVHLNLEPGHVARLSKSFQCEAYLVDHQQSPRLLTTPGLGYRLAPNLDARDGRSHAPWGSTVRGVAHNKDWLKVGDRFLPIRLHGDLVLHLRSSDSLMADGGSESSGTPRPIARGDSWMTSAASAPQTRGPDPELLRMTLQGKPPELQQMFQAAMSQYQELEQQRSLEESARASVEKRVLEKRIEELTKENRELRERTGAAMANAAAAAVRQQEIEQAKAAAEVRLAEEARVAEELQSKLSSMEGQNKQLQDVIARLNREVARSRDHSMTPTHTPPASAASAPASARHRPTSEVDTPGRGGGFGSPGSNSPMAVAPGANFLQSGGAKRAAGQNATAVWSSPQISPVQTPRTSWPLSATPVPRARMQM